MNESLIFGKMIKKLRRSKKLTQFELSEATGINRVAIAKMETGKQSPRLEQIIKIANFLGFSLQEVQELSKS